MISTPNANPDIEAKKNALSALLANDPNAIDPATKDAAEALKTAITENGGTLPVTVNDTQDVQQPPEMMADASGAKIEAVAVDDQNALQRQNPDSSSNSNVIALNTVADNQTGTSKNGGNAVSDYTVDGEEEGSDAIVDSSEGGIVDGEEKEELPG